MPQKVGSLSKTLSKNMSLSKVDKAVMISLKNRFLYTPAVSQRLV